MSTSTDPDMPQGPVSVLVLHGPNLNLLGSREPAVYGHDTLADIEQELEALGQSMGADVVCRQSNHEGQLIEWLHQARWPEGDALPMAGVVFNPGGYTHTSVALRDAISAIEIPCVEVHMSNVHARESFRQTSMLSPVCVGTVTGFGKNSYRLGLRALLDYLRSP